MNNLGIGGTDELNLRVSVATLVRVIFKHPGNGEWMLALEHKATLQETKVEVRSQPFGGAIRIHDPRTMQELIGGFHFDSEHSRAEQDFRIFIRPSNWEAVREFCLQHINRDHDPILETDPTRELAEEFADALKINLKPEQYVHKAVAIVVENAPAPTDNIYARGIPTARIYRIFEARIVDSSLIHILMTNSECLSHQDLCGFALEDAQNGGKGRANAILALSLKRLTEHYLALSPDERTAPILFESNQLDETVSAILEGVPVPKYQRTC